MFVERRAVWCKIHVQQAGTQTTHAAATYQTSPGQRRQRLRESGMAVQFALKRLLHSSDLTFRFFSSAIDGSFWQPSFALYMLAVNRSTTNAVYIAPPSIGLGRRYGKNNQNCTCEQEHSNVIHTCRCRACEILDPADNVGAQEAC